MTSDNKKVAALNKRINTGLSHNAETSVIGTGIGFILVLLLGLYLYIGGSKDKSEAGLGGLIALFGALFLFIAFFIFLTIIVIIVRDKRKNRKLSNVDDVSPKSIQSMATKTDDVSPSNDTLQTPPST